MKEVKKFFGFIIAVFLLFLAVRYWPILEEVVIVALGASVPLVIGCVIAYVINILMNCYEKWYVKIFKVDVALKVKRVVCLIFAFLTLITMLLLVINLVLPEFINCVVSFVNMIPGVVGMVVEYVGEDQIYSYFPELKDGFDLSALSARMEQLLQTVISSLGGAVGSLIAAVGSMFTVVVDVVIGFVFALYILLEKEKLCKQSKMLVETYIPKFANKIFYTVKVFNESFHSFIVGQCVEAVILGCLCILGMLLLQLPYAVMIGVFIGFTALIPIVGAYLGAVVGAVMILTVSPFKAIQFLIFIVILQQLEGNLIYPKVVGKSIGLPGIWVLTAVTIGGAVMGIGGMLLAVPSFAAAYRLIKEDVLRRNPKVEEPVAVENKVVPENKTEE